jgi:peptide/nickel transport system substrate-binding protein
MRKKSRFLFITGMAVVLALVGAFQHESFAGDRDPRYGGTLVIGRSFEETTMDSLKANYGDMVFSIVSEGLLILDPYGNVTKPGFVESYTVSPDGLVYTFRFMEGAKFHDGVPLDAEAVAWNLKARVGDWRGEQFKYIPKENIIVKDKQTLVLKGTKYKPDFIFLLSNGEPWSGMVTPRAHERYGEEYGFRKVYGNGPFKFVEWIKGDRMVFERFEDYTWAPGFCRNNGPAYLKRVICQFIPEEATRIDMFKVGELDALIEVPFSRVDELKAMEGVQVFTIPGSAIYFSAFNTSKFPLDDSKVRKALNYGINRDLIVKKIFWGYGEAALNFYVDREMYVKGKTKEFYQYDPEKAKRLLAEAGWKRASQGEILEKDGKTLEFNLWTSNKTEFARLGEVLQGMWRELGVKVNLTQFDESTLRAKVAAGEHQATVWQHLWRGRNLFTTTFDPNFKWYPNQTGFSDEERLNRAWDAKNEREWQERTDDLQEAVMEAAALAPIVRPMYFTAVRDRVKNWIPRQKWWAWQSYLYDVYLEDVYRKNLEQ